jgi:hypothetical protein
MKHVIELIGVGNSGKSQTLNALIKKLYKASGNDDQVKLFYTGDNGQKLVYENRETIEYRGKRISVCTFGDDLDAVEANIEYFEGQNCDIVVSAARSKGQTKEALDNYANNKNAKVDRVLKGWVDVPEMSENKRQQEASDILVEATAQALFVIIDGLIDKME